MKLVNIGFGNMISGDRVLAVVAPDSAPIKRIIQDGKERGVLIDATYGRKTASVLVMDSNHVILSALNPGVIAERLNGKEPSEEEMPLES